MIFPFSHDLWASSTNKTTSKSCWLCDCRGINVFQNHKTGVYIAASLTFPSMLMLGWWHQNWNLDRFLKVSLAKTTLIASIILYSKCNRGSWINFAPQVWIVSITNLQNYWTNWNRAVILHKQEPWNRWNLLKSNFPCQNVSFRYNAYS